MPANSQAEYKLTFHPLAMSSDGAPHTGSAFFPIPDGTGLLYRLVGIADKPKPASVIERCDIAAATDVILFRSDKMRFGYVFV